MSSSNLEITETGGRDDPAVTMIVAIVTSQRTNRGNAQNSQKWRRRLSLALNGNVFKTEFTRGPGRGDTCHLSFLDETLPD